MYCNFPFFSIAYLFLPFHRNTHRTREYTITEYKHPCVSSVLENNTMHPVSLLFTVAKNFSIELRSLFIFFFQCNHFPATQVTQTLYFVSYFVRFGFTQVKLKGSIFTKLSVLLFRSLCVGCLKILLVLFCFALKILFI